MAAQTIRSEITVTVWKVVAQAGDALEADEPIMILESMKMEIPVLAPEAGRVVPRGRGWPRARRPGRRSLRRDVKAVKHSGERLQAASGADAEAPPLRTKPLGRQLTTMPEQIAERIFASIASGEYAPGDRIREETLAEQFEVSRGPVREALRILEKDSVVRILPNRGAHVTQLSAKEVGDIFEIRRKLSAAMVSRLSAQEAAALAAAIEPDVRALDALAQDPDGAAAYFDTTFRLSRALRESCGNERLAEILGSLARQTLRYTQLGLATPARRKESARNWRTLQKALKSGDLESAADAAEKLIEDSRREAVKQLEARQAAGAGHSNGASR